MLKYTFCLDDAGREFSSGVGGTTAFPTPGMD